MGKCEKQEKQFQPIGRDELVRIEGGFWPVYDLISHLSNLMNGEDVPFFMVKPVNDK